jgi:hypothetical protein
MSTRTYTVAIRGSLAKVLDKTTAAVYSKAALTAKTTETIKGPEVAGFVTGWKTITGGKTWVEILRPEASALVPVTLSAIYLLDDDITFVENPSYDRANDLDRPYDSDKKIIEPDETTTPGSTTPTKTTTGTTTTDTPYDTGNVGTVDVEKNPATETATEDKNKKWLTYGLYAILGIAAITLTVILVQSFRKPKKVKPA